MNENIIHPTAIIHPEAKIGHKNFIGPYCLIGPDVHIGNENRLEAFVSIGTAAEHRDFFHKEPGPVTIGDRNVIREYVTVNSGTKDTTKVGSHVTILRGSHIGHDCSIEDYANISCNVLVGGHTIVGVGANLGLAAVIHQFRVLGAYAMIGMNSTVTRHMPPFVTAFGSPCEFQRINRIGLLRAGVTEPELTHFENWFQNMRTGYDGIRDLQHDFNKYIVNFKKEITRVP